MKRLSSAIQACLVFLSVKTLFAYLDPGSGSLIVQVLIAVIVGILATFRFWKARLLSMFGIKQDSDDEDESDDID